MPLPRLALLVLAAALLLPACQRTPAPADSALAATADPAQAVLQANRRFATVRAFHAEMTLHGAQPGQVVRMKMDFVAPDRYRLDTPSDVQTIIGGTLFAHRDGRSEQLPLPPALLQQWRSPLPTDADLHGWTVEDRGPAALAGAATRVYRLYGPQGSGETLQYWVDAQGLPRQIQRDGFSSGQPFRIVLRYSRLDDPALKIAAP